MARTDLSGIEHPAKPLVERIARSRCFTKSARLRDMLLYLSTRAFEDKADQIHEQEVGHRVFGRPPNYDTSTDNIVRVHASMLRKRLEQYFAAEGANEQLILEIPKGNYAPVFRERSVVPANPPNPDIRNFHDWRTWALLVLGVLFLSSAILVLSYFRSAASTVARELASKPAVFDFWSGVFRTHERTDIVLDDADLALYQELTGRKVLLSEYFDRSYLRRLNDSASRELDGNLATAIVLKRHSNFGSATLLWKLSRTANDLRAQTALYFARDYTFRALKADNVILLGNSRSNPWIESFGDRLTIGWEYNVATGAYYPVDLSAGPGAQTKFLTAVSGAEPRDGYAVISLLPNLGHTGSVLILSSSGGAAMDAAADFLSEESSVRTLRSLLLEGTKGGWPYFEALIKINTRSSLPKDMSVLICRRMKP